MISEQEKACADKIAKLEESLKKKKQVRLIIVYTLFADWLVICSLSGPQH